MALAIGAILVAALSYGVQTRKQMLGGGRVRVNSTITRSARTALAAGDIVEVGASGPSTALPPGLVHEDGDVIVVEKPAELLTIATARERVRTVYAHLMAHARTRTPPARVFVVHRLDRLASGLLVFATSAAAKRTLQAQFAAHTVERTYLAVVEGRVARPEGTIARPAPRRRARPRAGDARPGTRARGPGSASLVRTRLPPAGRPDVTGPSRQPSVSRRVLTVVPGCPTFRHLHDRRPPAVVEPRKNGFLLTLARSRAEDEPDQGGADRWGELPHGADAVSPPEPSIARWRLPDRLHLCEEIGTRLLPSRGSACRAEGNPTRRTLCANGGKSIPTEVRHAHPLDEDIRRETWGLVGDDAGRQTVFPTCAVCHDAGWRPPEFARVN